MNIWNRLKAKNIDLVIIAVLLLVGAYAIAINYMNIIVGGLQ